MKQIVNYCERHPRLLRVRDSVLKNLHDPNIPHHLIHNYYVEIAFKYLNDSLSILWEHWETDYRVCMNEYGGRSPVLLADFLS
ncbi:hypothetical protein A0J61_06317 [Choanephora cucurbitarum]|uniref:Uncharacterized protein n=1 Tax=Choanephora cucurbitarum TaxID=101091 RepID=A0A1C7N921_9FUNG|nr:hypothetical protein A0J61_06317 [Choanephora cucurbitarum]